MLLAIKSVSACEREPTQDSELTLKRTDWESGLTQE